MAMRRSPSNSSGGTKRDDRRVPRARLQVLADGEEVDAGRAHVVHDLHHLLARFTEADHDPRLGENLAVDLLGALQQPQRMEIARTRTDRQVEPRHGFEVVIEHIGRRREHRLERAVLAQEVRRQHLDGHRRRGLAQRRDDAGEVHRAAVGEIVPIDAR